ncbi:hypothetical protein [Amycolatopsis regifaucium]|uniref:hypothetical protein n=1 Tax=Amycolatopsis regifaucium TaxID=546365 RepID=UPI001160D337|nr:hypothetical protein [Amycolatopsis regifaucium]
MNVLDTGSDAVRVSAFVDPDPPPREASVPVLRVGNELAAQDRVGDLLQYDRPVDVALVPRSAPSSVVTRCLREGVPGPQRMRRRRMASPDRDGGAVNLGARLAGSVMGWCAGGPAG